MRVTVDRYLVGPGRLKAQAFLLRWADPYVEDFRSLSRHTVERGGFELPGFRDLQEFRIVERLEPLLNLSVRHISVAIDGYFEHAAQFLRPDRRRPYRKGS